LPNCPPQLAHKVKQQIRADISSLDIILHLEALQSFLTFMDTLTSGIKTVIKQTEESASAPMPDNISVHSWSTGPIGGPKNKQQRMFNIKILLLHFVGVVCNILSYTSNVHSLF